MKRRRWDEEEKRLEIYKSKAVYQETINDIEKLDGIDDMKSYLEFISEKLIKIESEIRYLRNRL